MISYYTWLLVGGKSLSQWANQPNIPASIAFERLALLLSTCYQIRSKSSKVIKILIFYKMRDLNFDEMKRYEYLQKKYVAPERSVALENSRGTHKYFCIPYKCQGVKILLWQPRSYVIGSKTYRKLINWIGKILERDLKYCENLIHDISKWPNNR